MVYPIRPFIFVGFLTILLSYEQIRRYRNQLLPHTSFAVENVPKQAVAGSALEEPPLAEGVKLIKGISNFNPSSAISSNQTKHGTPSISWDAMGEPNHMHTPFSQCMRNIHENIFSPSQIKQWKEKNFPVPISVKVKKDRLYILSLLYDNTMRLRHENHFFCNGKPAKELRTNRKCQNMLVLECDPSIDARNATLIFSGKPRPGVEDGKGNEFSFNINHLVDCERKAMDLQDQRSSQLRGEQMKVGIVAMFTGGWATKKARERALEWATYHHMIGVDHVFLYINENWDGGKGLANRDFITWIPFSGRIDEGGVTWELFRIAGMTDAVWRAQHMNMTWLINSDFDELVWLNDKYYDIGVEEMPPLKRFLQQYPNLRGASKSALELSSIPYGRNVSIHPKHKTTTEEKELMVDYVYRRKGDVSKHPASRREKLIVDTTQDIFAISHHFVGGGPFGNRLLHVDPREARINHYKRTEHGVFNGRFGNLDPVTETEVDYSMKDRFHVSLHNAMSLRP